MTMPRAGELTRLRSTQESSMVDTCEILERLAGEDAYNLPRSGYPVSGTSSPCGFKPGSKREVHEQGQVIVADAEVRLPVGTDVSHTDRIKITHLAGAALSTPLLYDVIGDPAQGKSGLVVTLGKVTDG